MVQAFAHVFRSRELRLAWLIAIVADAIQIAGFPFFAEGGFSPADTIVDLVAAPPSSEVLNKPESKLTCSFWDVKHRRNNAKPQTIAARIRQDARPVVHLRSSAVLMHTHGALSADNPK